jgi:pimeloyl-ACP methyl ester carboxylesterase
VPDPRAPDDAIFGTLGPTLAPDYRVLSVEPRPGQPYQVQAMDLLGTLDQFGLERPVLIGERLGCVAAVLVAAWHPGRIARLVLIDATFAAPSSFDNLEARALRDCPPDWPSLRAAVQCPVVERRWNTEAIDNLKGYLQIP